MLYFVLSLLYLIIVPFLADMALAVMIMDVSNGTSILYLLCSIAVYILTAYGYARIFLSQDRFKRPKTLIGFFLPLLVPFGMWVVMNLTLLDVVEVFDDYNTPTSVYILMVVNLWQVTIAALMPEELHYEMLVPAVHIAAMLAAWSGFCLTLRKKETEPLAAPVKKCAAFLTAVILFTAGCYYGRWYILMTTPSPNGKQDEYVMRYEIGNSGGYGFPYENGYSSVNLYPYHVENEHNRLAVLDEPSEFIISEENSMPVLDGAEAAYPVYSAFANACYENIVRIQDRETGKKPIVFTNTIEAYKSLLSGDVDIFFGAELSDEQLRMAEESGRELVMTPIAREAFVFFVSEDNPVDGLTSEQIRNIYSGKTNNWLLLGGGFMPILAYQRPENSGSQTRMQYFMGDTPLKEPLEVEFESAMIGIIRGVADYENRPNAIGYSFRYYATQMTGDAEKNGIKLLALDGIAPTVENIQNGTYPMSGNLMAITLADNPNPNVSAFVDWMTGEQGQELIEKTGYVQMPK